MGRPARLPHPILPALALGIALLLVASAVAAGGLKPPPKQARDAEFELHRLADRAPSGDAYLRQKRRRLRGHVTVTGLEPGSSHDWNLIGPRGRCDRQVSRFAVSPGDDLVADANGVATAQVRERVPESVVRRGYYLLIQEFGSAGPPPTARRSGAPRKHPGHPAHGPNPGIACGEVR